MIITEFMWFSNTEELLCQYINFSDCTHLNHLCLCTFYFWQKFLKILAWGKKLEIDFSPGMPFVNIQESLILFFFGW